MTEISEKVLLGSRISYIEPVIRLVIGATILLLAAGFYFLPDLAGVWLAIAVFVVIGLFGSGLTQFCIMAWSLRRLGLRSEWDELKALERAHVAAQTRASYLDTLNLLNEAIVEMTPEGTLLWTSDSWPSLFGGQAEPKFHNHLKAEDVAKFDDMIMNLREGGHAKINFHRCSNKRTVSAENSRDGDDEEGWLEGNFTLSREGEGNTVVRGVLRDITERIHAEENQKIAATAFETQEGIIITDSGGTIVRVNNAFTKITGYSAAESIGNKPAMLRSGRHDAGFYENLWSSLQNSGHWQGEVWNRRKNGDIYPEWLTITAVARNDGVISHYVAVFSDITERKSAEEQIHQLAFYDALTNLPNRRMLFERCNQLLHSSARHKIHGAILYIDLDRFKTLNDTRGHNAGDMLLAEVARRLVSCVRTEDTVARMGGDEFVVVLKDLGSEAASTKDRVLLVAEKIRASLNAPYLLDDYTHTSSPSIGICLFDGTEDSFEELLIHADKAMYQAKAAGRNKVCLYDQAEVGGT